MARDAVDTPAPAPATQEVRSVMRQATFDRFFPFTTKLEGPIPFFYLDVYGYVTIAIGLLADTSGARLDQKTLQWSKPGFDPWQHDPGAMVLGLPLKRADGSAASKMEIADEWHRVKAAKDLARLGHRAAERITKLRLTSEALRILTEAKLAENERTLKKHFPDLDEWCADAQLAVHSMAWAVGANLPSVYPRLTAALRAWDFGVAPLRDANRKLLVPGKGAAGECFMRETDNPGVRDRNDANERLFENARHVGRSGLDPDVLWYPAKLTESSIPSTPSVPLPPGKTDPRATAEVHVPTLRGAQLRNVSVEEALEHLRDHRELPSADPEGEKKG